MLWWVVVIGAFLAFLVVSSDLTTMNCTRCSLLGTELGLPPPPFGLIMTRRGALVPMTSLLLYCSLFLPCGDDMMMDWLNLLNPDCSLDHR